MINPLFFIKYYLLAGNEHSIQPPFLFNLYTKVISKFSPDIVEIAQMRNKLLNDKTTIERYDLGAGSKINSSSASRICDIAMHSLSSSKKSLLHLRLIQYFNYKVIIELGTSLGINTLYLSKADTTVKVITLEGSPSIAEIAKLNFKALNANNIELVQGNFDNTFLPALNRIEKADYIFFDGNHKCQPTYNYFIQSLNFLHSDSLLVFDDIHWSTEMENAWDMIKAHPRVTLSVDLLYLGLVFISPNLSKQNFILRF